MKKILFASLLLLLVGCSEEKEPIPVEELHHVAFDFPEAIIGYAKDIQTDGDWLIISDSKQDSLFHRIDLNKSLYMGMFGLKGQGPEEIIYPSRMNALGNGCFSCYDSNRNELKLLSLETDGDEVAISRLFRCHNFMTFDVASLSDNRFILNGETNSAMFALINAEGGVLSLSDTYPYKDEEEKKIPDRFRAMAYQGTLRVNSNGHFAYAIIGAKQLHLYKVENDSIVKIGEVIDGYGHYEPDMSTEGAYSVAHYANSPESYMDLAVTDDYVYALYSGRTFKEYQMQVYEGETIYVYNWKGVLQKAYKLDVPITKFCIDEQEKKIYATANMPEPTIVSFDLN